jgi:hypothetical protein
MPRSHDVDEFSAPTGYVEDGDDWRAKSPDASRIGTAVEYLVAATCILASRGELNVSTALVDDEGVDLVFHRRGASATLAVQVKARTTDTKVVRSGRFLALVRGQTFRPRSGYYLLFVVADVASATFDAVWLVPSNDYVNLARHAPDGTLRMSASLSETTDDRWRPYRLSRAELPGRLLELLPAD